MRRVRLLSVAKLGTSSSSCSPPRSPSRVAERSSAFDADRFPPGQWPREMRRYLRSGMVRLRHAFVAVRGERLALIRLEVGTAESSPGAPRDEMLQLCRPRRRGSNCAAGVVRRRRHRRCNGRTRRRARTIRTRTTEAAATGQRVRAADPPARCCYRTRSMGARYEADCSRPTSPSRVAARSSAFAEVVYLASRMDIQVKDYPRALARSATAMWSSPCGVSAWLSPDLRSVQADARPRRAAGRGSPPIWPRRGRSNRAADLLRHRRHRRRDGRAGRRPRAIRK